MKKRVFGYLRVSSKGQLDGDGFDRQRATIEAYCERNNLHVIRWFEERGVSGMTDYDARDAMVEMGALMGPGTADTFIVEKADRLARDLIVGELIIDDFRKRGLHIMAADSDMDLTCSSDATRVLIRQILGALAQWDKSNLVRRMRLARDRIRATGGRAEGVVRWEDKSPLNRALALEMLMLHKSGKSFLEISRDLNRRKVPSPTGQRWAKSTAHALVQRFDLTDEEMKTIVQAELKEEIYAQEPQ